MFLDRDRALDRQQAGNDRRHHDTFKVRSSETAHRRAQPAACGSVGIGTGADDVHRSARRVATKQQALRTTQNLQSFDVERVEQRAPLKCQRNAVDGETDAGFNGAVGILKRDAAQADLRCVERSARA